MMSNTSSTEKTLVFFSGGRIARHLVFFSGVRVAYHLVFSVEDVLLII
jgi:hypothetical protein